MSSPLARSKAHLESLGYTVAKVEHWNSFAHVRQDLFGMFDLLVLQPGYPGVLGVQVTTAANVSARVKKCRANPVLAVWLACGNRAYVDGWQKVKGRWQVRVVELTARVPLRGN